MGVDAKVERERVWREHVRAWQKSGLSQAAYCRRHALQQADFSWWKSEIGRRDELTSMAAEPAFVPVNVGLPQTAAYAFELELCGGRVLRFDARIDPAALNAVVRVLESAQPGTGSC